MAQPAAPLAAEQAADNPRPVPITVPSPLGNHHHHHLVDRRDTPRGRVWEPERARSHPEAMDGVATKLVTGDAGYVLEDVPHLSDYLPDLPVSAAFPRGMGIVLHGSTSGDRERLIDRCGEKTILSTRAVVGCGGIGWDHGI